MKVHLLETGLSARPSMFTIHHAGVQCYTLGIPIVLAGVLLTHAVVLLDTSLDSNAAHAQPSSCSSVCTWLQPHLRARALQVLLKAAQISQAQARSGRTFFPAAAVHLRSCRASLVHQALRSAAWHAVSCVYCMSRSLASNPSMEHVQCAWHEVKLGLRGAGEAHIACSARASCCCAER